MTIISLDIRLLANCFIRHLCIEFEDFFIIILSRPGDAVFYDDTTEDPRVVVFAPGPYNIRLKVSDPFGNTAEDFMTIDAVEPVRK